MSLTPDEVFAEIRQIRAAQDEVDPGSAAYTRLERRRLELKGMARDAIDQARNRTALEQELEYLETRLSRLEDDRIEVPTWQKTMRRYTINDPGASARRINDELDRNTEDDRAAIEARIVRLRRVLAE
jgi:hypothetical protein